jgi:hypothetical protein
VAAAKKKIRVGLLVDSLEQSAWAFKMLEADRAF